MKDEVPPLVFTTTHALCSLTLSGANTALSLVVEDGIKIYPTVNPPEGSAAIVGSPGQMA